MAEGTDHNEEENKNIDSGEEDINTEQLSEVSPPDRNETETGGPLAENEGSIAQTADESDQRGLEKARKVLGVPEDTRESHPDQTPWDELFTQEEIDEYINSQARFFHFDIDADGVKDVLKSELETRKLREGMDEALSILSDRNIESILGTVAGYYYQNRREIDKLVKPSEKDHKRLVGSLKEYRKVRKEIALKTLHDKTKRQSEETKALHEEMKTRPEEESILRERALEDKEKIDEAIDMIMGSQNIQRGNKANPKFEKYVEFIVRNCFRYGLFSLKVGSERFHEAQKGGWKYGTMHGAWVKPKMCFQDFIEPSMVQVRQWHKY
jgi:hypothetical protein